MAAQNVRHCVSNAKWPLFVSANRNGQPCVSKYKMADLASVNTKWPLIVSFD